MIRELDSFAFLMQMQGLRSPLIDKMALLPEVHILASYSADGKGNGFALWSYNSAEMPPTSTGGGYPIEQTSGGHPPPLC